MFWNNKLISAFKRVKKDITVIENNQELLKLGVNDWIVHLNAKQNRILSRIEALERKFNRTEAKTTDFRLESLKEI